jgi:hypothetical protein
MHLLQGYPSANDAARSRLAGVHGGRLAPRDTVCSGCNNALGPIEDNLRDSLSHSFASVGATNDDRAPIEVTIEFAGRAFRLADGNAELQVGGTRFDREAKSMIVPLAAGFDNQVESLAKAMWSHGLGPDDVHRLNLAPGDPEPELPVGPTRHDHDLSLGGSIEHKRVFVKMAIELLAVHRHDLAMRGELSQARRFVRHGGGTVRSKPDSRSPGSGLIDIGSLPEVYNAIEVWSFGNSVFFRVVFLGPLVFTGMLTAAWLGDRFRAVYAFDARNPAKRIADGIELCDGPNLAVWIDDIAIETTAKAVDALEALSLRLATSRTPPQREEPPDLERIRAAVATKLSEYPPRPRRKPKPG